MAYSNYPTLSTYETKRITAAYDLDIPPGSLAANSSFGMRNLVPVKHGNEVWAETRYGISSNDITGNTSTFMCRGMYVWEKTVGTLYYFVVVSDTTALTSKVYTSTDRSTWTAVTTLTNYATTPVRFTEFLDATNTKKLVLVDGIEGYVFTSNAAGTKIVDVDFPTPHVPFPVFLDGYLFLAKAGTGDIYNSDLNDPAVWTAGSFISAEMYPDDIQALLKIDNYLVAVGTQSCEYFYDAANPTASPMARIEGATLAFGTPFPNSIAYSKNMAIFLANNNDGGVSLRAIQGTKTQELSCPFITLFNVNLIAGTTSAAVVRGWFLRQGQDLCYGFSFDGVTGTTSAVSPTLVYNIGTSMWTEFTTGTNPDAFPIYFTASTSSNNVVTYLAGHYNKAGTQNNIAFFGTYDPTPTTGTGTSFGGQDRFVKNGGGPGSTVNYDFTQEIRTTIQDFDQTSLKTQSRFYIVNTNTGLPTFTLYWDDSATYASFTSGVTPINGSDDTLQFITQMGAFRQRIYKVTCNEMYARLKYFDITINRMTR